MRAVIQRVLKASVSVDEQQVSSVGRGICVFIGISRDDKPNDIDFIVRKLLNLRIFPDEKAIDTNSSDGDSTRRWDKSTKDLGLEILCVSQFTLYSKLKGNRLDFHTAMPPLDAKAFYDNFLARLRCSYCNEKVKDGVFGALMQINIQNDGPVTITLESKNLNEEREQT